MNNAYYDYLSQQGSADTVDPARAAWLIEKLKAEYIYDPKRDYLPEFYQMEHQEYKKQKGESYESIEQTWQAIFFSSSNLSKGMPYVHKFIFHFWSVHKSQQFRRNWKPSNDVGKGLGYMFITLNFKSGVDVHIAVQNIQRITSLPIFKCCSIKYVIEKYTTAGEHIHCHMFVELKRAGTISMSLIEQKIFQLSKLKEILRVDYKFSWARDYDKRCQSRDICNAYITGNKIPKKMEHVELDRLFRRENNLEELYVIECV